MDAFEALERRAKREKIKCDTSQAVYVGLEIPRKFIVQKIAEGGETQPLLELFWMQNNGKEAATPKD